ncbi:uncharacterized protein NPIL_564031 [Nephila pilipes]|uniref:Peptidase aspartic putative domain-containing protein n=1 Tax=Nephila pilipes TaxID=299642 RepID=A0A8X6PME6_NEPPI|nr:uncharacterized protein NPIL_564031 [Nephila pilipes]
MVNLARTGFASHQNPRRKEFQNEQLKQSGESSTASALVSLQKPAEAKLFFANAVVLIRCHGQNKIIRAVIDSGSQSSYVSQKIMTQLKAFPLRTETVIHALFGGDETEPKNHKVFAIEHSMSLPANKLWELEVLGIPSEKEKKDFNDKIKILLVGRYEVELLWKLDSSNLPNACRGAYVACVFVRSEVGSESKVTFIRAKNRVAPVKPLSIHRLELMACCIGARLVNSVIRALGRDGKIRTVELKTQYGTVLRPIQRIYPLEIYSKESVDRELGGEEYNSNKVTDNENNVTSADAVLVRQFTSSGRPVKNPYKTRSFE